jgi:phage gp46-like protein
VADIATKWVNGAGAWLLQGGALLSDDGLQTAVTLSLFTDRLADVGDVLPGAQTNRRGWWGDALADEPGDLIGSRLWLLARSKEQSSVLRRAKDYASEALRWLLDDGIARALDVQAEWQKGQGSASSLCLLVTVTRNTDAVVRYRFEDFWKGA